ncbi:DUF4214 domain-containing protein [Chromatocurvus halotolerans]|uniref:Reprolysin-like metallo-peptidase family M12B n=1 Tax=Chromatocurvus halotolerans TaxID=1132028 RepID=A0A4V2SA10_9GAMM|nr:DUF4214 domain-containing protein [Chromatocurvus halotolerans]TCO69870.1 reprolysin-like metallo-peptidase family M12B [Chromatocurvus halotolerans]
MATPTSSSTPVTTIPFLGDNAVDSLLFGNKWGGGLGSGVELTFSFPEGQAYFSRDYGSYEGAEWYDGWSPLSPGQRDSAREALAAIGAVADIRFSETLDNEFEVGEIRLAITESRVEEGFSAWAYLPSTRPAGGDIWLGNNDFAGQAIAPLSSEFFTVLHEIGHALGLKHPFDDEKGNGARLPGGPAGTDNYFYTIMSYTSDPTGNDYYPDRYPTTPMLLDIQALQYLYGENRRHAGGDNTYVFSDTGRYWETIWDSGGIDTIDYQAAKTGATIDLRQGSWSSLGQPIEFRSNGFVQYTDERTVWIAFGTEIEEALGGEAGDTLYGNDLDNYLYGHWGEDALYGFDGDDILRLSLDVSGGRLHHAGSPGYAGLNLSVSLDGRWSTLDRFEGGAGYDTLLGINGYDTVIRLDRGQEAPQLVSVEVIVAGDGDDVIDLTSPRFSYPAVEIYGGDGNDVIWSSDGNDDIAAGEGDDWVHAGPGSDRVYGGPGDDSLYSGPGSDFMDGGEGYDTALYVGVSSAYRIEPIDGGLRVEHLLSGDVDTLYNIQALTFDDATLPVTTFAASNAAPVLEPPAPLVLVANAAGDYAAITGTLGATDADGDNLTYSLLGQVSASGDSEQRSAASLGELTLFTDTGEFEFSPFAGASALIAAGAVASFTVQVSDGDTAASAVLTLGDFSGDAFTLDDPTDDGIYWDAGIVAVSGGAVSAQDAQLYRAYSGVLGRMPDNEGFDWWSGQIAASEHTLESMVEGFLWSQEFLGFFPGSSQPGDIGAEAFVLHMYQNVFDREPDPDGFAWWTGELVSGSRDQAQVVVDMTQSNEFVGLTAGGAVDYLIG